MVLHRCSNRACIRASHLYAGNAQDNADDRSDAGNFIANYGENNGQASVTELQASEILWLTTNCLWLIHREIGEHYNNISETTVRDIKCRRTWKNISPKRPTDWSSWIRNADPSLRGRINGTLRGRV
jgi:hypothetical protein